MGSGDITRSTRRLWVRRLEIDATVMVGRLEIDATVMVGRLEIDVK